MRHRVSSISVHGSAPMPAVLCGGGIEFTPAPVDAEIPGRFAS
jgi:hypothetical protein